MFCVIGVWWWHFISLFTRDVTALLTGGSIVVLVTLCVVSVLSYILTADTLVYFTVSLVQSTKYMLLFCLSCFHTILLIHFVMFHNIL